MNTLLILTLLQLLTMPVATRLSTADGLPDNNVRAIVQDTEGYLWVGSSQGLSRYDGHNFLVPQPPGGGLAVMELRLDSLHQLLWVSSSANTIACYDLHHHRYLTDYLDTLAADAPLPEVHLSARNTVFAGEHFGLRQIYFEDGRPHARDFTEANGRLRANRMRPVCEDSRGTLWLPTHHGLATLRPDGQLRYVRPDGVWRAALCRQERVYVIDDANELYVFDLDGRALSQMHIPRPMGSTEMVWFHFEWQGRWVMLGRDHAIVFDLATSSLEAHPAWDVAAGRIVAQTGAYTWVHDAASRELCLFCPNGEVRRLRLLPQSVLDMGITARYSIVQTGPQRFCIATNGNGLFSYDADTGTLTHHSAYDPHPLLHSDYLLAACADRSGSLWLGNELVGLTRLMPDPMAAETLLPDTDARHDRSNHITACHAIAPDRVAVATRDGNLYTYDTRRRELTPTAYVRNSVYALHTDHYGRLWIGTRGSGVTVDGRQYDPSTQPACPSSHINSITEDSSGRVWLGSLADGLIAVDELDGKLSFRPIALGGNAKSRVNALCLDFYGNLWVGTSTGLFVADTHASQLGEADFKPIDWGGKTHDIVCLTADSLGRVWVGMRTEGAVRVERHPDGEVQTPVALWMGKRQDVVSVLVAAGGIIWFGTEDGLICWDQATETVVSHRRSADHLSNVCTARAATLTDQGDCLIGTAYGLMRVPSRDVPSVAAQPRPILTDIIVGDSSLTQAGNMPGRGEVVELRHDENTLTLRFSTLDLTAEATTGCIYWLEGADAPWSRTTAEGCASYDDLPPGHYRLHVAPTVEAGEAGETVLVEIHIRQPWWNTWWAWCIYVMTAVALTATIVLPLIVRTRLRNRLRAERRLTQLRTDFFTQVSHELRTPLALIRSGVDAMDDSHASRELQVIRRGTRRLSQLVDQLLLFRRINEQAVRLQVADTDIISLVRDAYADFYPLAERRGVRMVFEPFDRHALLTTDRDMAETIVCNLISNAVKYTPEGGQVRIGIPKPAEGWLRISILNSAQPLSEQQRQQLFQPYMHGYISSGGMGIGLYVAHQLARLCHGDLVYDEADGGVRFTLSLPTDASVFTAEERNPHPVPLAQATSVADVQPTATPNSPLPPTPLQLLPRSANSQRVLIVEDDSDMAEQLRQQVGAYFNVEAVADGSEAWQRILSSPPDILLADIMLPSLDGYALTRKLRANAATATLPVILLTAYRDDAHHVRALEGGADVFLSKPCHPDVLISHIAQLLRRAAAAPQRQADTAGSPASAQPEAAATPQPPSIVTSMADDRFRQRVRQLVSQHLAQPGFSVDALTAEMGMGRTVFFQRFKQVMGMSPSEYVKAERMELAARLLREDSLNVSEVAARTGFTDNSHFIRAFKAFYGQTPLQFRQA